MTDTKKVVPFEYETHQIRSILFDDQPWFLATDICQTLDLSDASTALRKLDDDEKQKAPRKLYGVEGGSDVWLVNESGLYALIMRSNKPEAKAFRKWVTSVVLPALRKQGSYEVPQGVRTDVVDDDLLLLVREAIAKCGSLSELARRIGVSQATLSQLVNRIPWSFGATMLHKIRNRCREIIQEPVDLPAPTLSADFINLLLQVDDKELRGDLFTEYRKTLGL